MAAGFARMKQLTRRAALEGARLVMGGHSTVPICRSRRGPVARARAPRGERAVAARGDDRRNGNRRGVPLPRRPAGHDFVPASRRIWWCSATIPFGISPPSAPSSASWLRGSGSTSANSTILTRIRPIASCGQWLHIGKRLRDLGLVGIEAQGLAERGRRARCIAERQPGQAETVQRHGRRRAGVERSLEVGEGVGGTSARGQRTREVQQGLGVPGVVLDRLTKQLSSPRPRVPFASGRRRASSARTHHPGRARRCGCSVWLP